MSEPATLYIVPTPIGNLDDISPRALTVLSEVDWIAAEDTRHTHKLLQHFSVNTRTLSLHEPVRLLSVTPGLYWFAVAVKRGSLLWHCPARVPR